MKEGTHKLCTFVFTNGTQLRAAVPYMSWLTGQPCSYNDLFVLAKATCWHGDEEAERGPLTSFTVDKFEFPVMIK